MDRLSILSLQKKKKIKEPIVALTCYDAFTARLIDPHVDISLVGDSVANTRLGYANTIPVTLDEMIHHTRSAARGIQNSLLVADLPFQSYEASPTQAAISAGRLIKEGGAKAVKLEGGRRVAKSIEAILKVNVPVMGHLGLVPQSIYKEGGYFVHGKKKTDADFILKEALLLESMGVFAIVLEGIPAALGKKISRRLKIPTIGIGAGAYCDGQILVLDDLLGLGDGPTPKFVKKYASLREPMVAAVKHYRGDVLSHRFPTEDYSY